jgi:RNA polymerase sigma-70 factor (ECF subfamily)
MGISRQQGEERFRSFFLEHYRVVLAYALRRTDQEADAHDVVAATFAVAWRRFDRCPSDRELERPWLYAIARRALANQRRAQRRISSLRDRLARSGAPGPGVAAVADSRADLREIAAALGRLGEEDRELVRLVAWEGVSTRGLAEALGCSQNAAAIRLHRARRRLADELEKERLGTGHTFKPRQRRNE